MTVRTIVLWSATDADEFRIRYRAEHLPLVRALPGLTAAAASPLRSRSYSLMAELSFSDIGAMRAAFASDQGAALLAHTAELENAFAVKANSVVALESLD